MSKKKNDKRAKRAKIKAKQSRIQRNSIQRPRFSRMTKPRMKVLNPEETKEAVSQGFKLAKIAK